MTTLPDFESQPSDNIASSRLRERAIALSMQAFMCRFESRHILLVRLSTREPGLGDELSRCFGAGVPPASDPPRVVDLTTYTQSTWLGSEPGESAVSRLRRLEHWLSLSPCFPVPIAERGRQRDHAVTVGRARDSDLCLRRKGVSRQHARFEIDAGGDLWLLDLDSSNGTYLDVCALMPGKRALVEPGAALRFGRVECMYVTPDLFWTVLHAND
jgi:hypothetical protein